MFLRASLTALAMLAGVSMHAPVAAATITQSYDFSFTFENEAPVTSWSGAFTVTFDPSATGPVTVNGFTSDLPAIYGDVFGGTITFLPGGFDPAFQTVFPDRWFLELCSGIPCQPGPFSNFSVLTMNFENVLTETSTPTNSDATVARNTDPGAYVSIGGSVTMRDTLVTDADVPEPATLSLLVAGLAGLAMTRRRSRAAAVA